MADTPDDPLLAYLREHGERYSLDALRLHLLAQGFDAERVDAALVSYRQERGAGEPGLFSSFSAGRERPSVLATIAVVLAVIAGVALLLAGTCTGVGGLVAMGGNDVPSALALLAVAAAVIWLAVALIVSPVRWYRRQSAPPRFPPSNEKVP